MSWKSLRIPGSQLRMTVHRMRILANWIRPANMSPRGRSNVGSIETRPLRPALYDHDVITWKRVGHHWPYMIESTDYQQIFLRNGDLMFTLLLDWTHCWSINRVVSDDKLPSHYDIVCCISGGWPFTGRKSITFFITVSKMMKNVFSFFSKMFQ